MDSMHAKGGHVKETHALEGDWIRYLGGGAAESADSGREGRPQVWQINAVSDQNLAERRKKKQGARARREGEESSDDRCRGRRGSRGENCGAHGRTVSVTKTK